MPSRQVSQLPFELSQFIEDQQEYSFGQQAAWRHIRRVGHDYFVDNAHPAYQESVRMLLIPVEYIPIISNLDSILDKVHFGAIGVNGFIPPPAFVGLQSRGVMPISTDMRRPANLGYTPAPDIMHEGLGHLAMLSDPKCRDVIQYFGKVGLLAGATERDQRNYEAIRKLSILEEDPTTSPMQLDDMRTEVLASEEELNNNPTAAKLVSRLYWRTIEYGLIQHDNRPKIYGAGIISSIEESRRALADDIDKPRLSLDVINDAYDITKPQLYYSVADSWDHIVDVLHDLESLLRRDFKADINEKLVETYKGIEKSPTRASTHHLNSSERHLDAVYATLRFAREKPDIVSNDQLERLWPYLQLEHSDDWLAPMELLENLAWRDRSHSMQTEISSFLSELASSDERLENIVNDGLQLIRENRFRLPVGGRSSAAMTVARLSGSRSEVLDMQTA